MTSKANDPDLIDQETYQKQLQAQAQAMVALGSAEESILELAELDKDQFHGGPIVVGTWTTQRVRESPGLRELFEIRALDEDPKKAEFARLVLQAAKDFKYRR